MQLRYAQTLAKIWYDFDSLQSAQRRPIQSFERLQRDIETLTQSLVNNTRQFLEERGLLRSPSHEDSEQKMEDEGDVGSQYLAFVRLLNI